MVQLVARSCLVRRLLTVGRQGQDMRWLAIEPQGVRGPVLAHWWVELVSRVGGHGPGTPESSVSLVVTGAKSHSGWLKGPRCLRAGGWG